MCAGQFKVVSDLQLAAILVECQVVSLPFYEIVVIANLVGGRLLLHRNRIAGVRVVGFDDLPLQVILDSAIVLNINAKPNGCIVSFVFKIVELSLLHI